MDHNKKSPKGEISIDNHRGKIRLRWRFEGQRYPLTLPYTYVPENMHHAKIKVAEIELDMMKGCFDTTLEKYKPVKSKPVTKPDPVLPESKPVFLNDMVEKFNYWGHNIRNIDVANSHDYFYTRRLLEKWLNIPIDQIATKLKNENWADTTYNRRLNYLKLFFTWMVGNGSIAVNPLLEVCRKRKKRKKKNPKREPLEEAEIIALLDAIKNDTYCPAASRFKHSHYYPFLAFIFHTGVRNAEAIGLKVKHIDFAASTIEISETLARTIRGAHHAARVEKGTKMENVRYLPLTEEMREILLIQVEGKGLNELVFKSPMGLSIDDRMFQRRILKPVLKDMKISARDLYSGRHSMGTRAIQQGMPLTDLAYLMGHSTIETAARNYVSVSKPAVSLPSLKKQGK